MSCLVRNKMYGNDMFIHYIWIQNVAERCDGGIETERIGHSYKL